MVGIRIHNVTKQLHYMFYFGKEAIVQFNNFINNIIYPLVSKRKRKLINKEIITICYILAPLDMIANMLRGDLYTLIKCQKIKERRKSIGFMFLYRYLGTVSLLLTLHRLSLSQTQCPQIVTNLRHFLIFFIVFLIHVIMLELYLH